MSGENSLRRFWFPCYLAFTVVFYSYRWIFGMGSAETTIYEADAPAIVRVSKDFVWFGVLALPFLCIHDAAVVVWENLKNNFTFFAIWAGVLLWFQFTGVIHLFYNQTVSDTLLYWYRYPLEYMPIAIVLPVFAVQFGRLAKVALWLCVFVVAFLAIEIASGRTGFGWGGLWTRYGSAFGSPNDFGVFCAVCLVGVVLCAQKRWHYLVAVCLGFALLATQSRSAILGCFAGLAAVSYRKAPRRALLALSAIVVAAVACLAMFQPELLEMANHLSANDGSASMRLEEWTRFAGEFRSPSAMVALFGTDYFHVESWYVALLLRTGVIGLILFVALIGVSLHRCWKLRHDDLHAVALGGIAVIAMASAFIPYPDVFPTNFYLWLAVGMAWLPPGNSGSNAQAASQLLHALPAVGPHV